MIFKSTLTITRSGATFALLLNMITAAIVSIWLMFQILPVVANAADGGDQSFTLSNGSRITYEDKTGNFKVKTTDGKVRTYTPGSYLNLLKGSELSSESRDVRAQATRFVINTASPLSQANAPRDRLDVMNVSSDQLSQLDRVMGAKSAAAPAAADSKPKGERVVMSASDLADFLGPNAAKNIKYVAANDQRIKKLGAPPDSSSDSPSKIEPYVYAGRMTSNRAGSKALAAGVEINHSYGFEYSCEDEGKQPSDVNGPIRNINRICNLDAVKYFPFTDKFEVFIEGGITHQVGKQGEPGYRYKVPQQWNGKNIGVGMKEQISRHVAIELRTRLAQYEQLNPGADTPGVYMKNGRFFRDGPVITDGHNFETIGAKLLTSLGIRVQFGPGSRSGSSASNDSVK